MLGHIVCSTQRGEVVCQRDLEMQFGIRRSSITTLLQGLEQSGFITRISVEGDARLKSIVPTERGLACHAAIEECIHSFEQELTRGISSEQMELTRATLHRILANLQIMEQNYTERKED